MIQAARRPRAATPKLRLALPVPLRLAPPRFGQLRDIVLASCTSVLLTLVFLVLPFEVAAAISIVAFAAVLILVDVWLTVLLLLLLRSSLDVFSSTTIVGDWNVAALLTLLLIAVCLTQIVTNRVKISSIPLTTPFLGLVAVSAVSVSYAPDPLFAFEQWLRMLGVFLLYIFMADRLRTDRQRSALVNVVILSALVPLSLGLYQLVTNTGDHFTPGYNRVFATFAHPSPFAFYLLTVLPVALAFIFYSRRGWPKVCVAIVVALIPVGVIMTFTRDAWAGMLVTVLVIAAAKKPSVFFPLLLVLLGAYLFSPTIQGRLSDVGSDSSTFAWRLDQWQEAVELMAPWQLPFGIGSGGVDILTGEAAHNDYVRVLSEWGILGSLAFVSLYVSVVRQSFAAYRGATTVFQRELALAFIALVIARLLMFFTDNIFVNPVLEWYFWSLAALTLSRSQSPAESPEGAYVGRGAKTPQEGVVGGGLN